MRFVMSPYAFGVRLMRRIRLVRDRRGVSAVEFALILPTIIGLYLGIAETGNAITVYRRMSTIASTAADLTAQVKAVSTVGFAGHRLCIERDPVALSDTTPLKIVLSSVVADENNNGKVDWSYSNKGSGRADNSAYACRRGLPRPVAA